MRDIKAEMKRSAKRQIKSLKRLIIENPKNEKLKEMLKSYENRLDMLEGKDDLQNTVREED